MASTKCKGPAVSDGEARSVDLLGGEIDTENTEIRDDRKARHPGGPPLAFGQRVICNQPAGVFRACQCGGTIFTVAEGVGPHIGQLICEQCQRRGRWLGRFHFSSAM